MDLEHLRLADLETFLDVSRAGSINGAARARGSSPSQVSKAVARLEEQLGCKLLGRSARGVQVSDAGERLVPELERLLERIRALGGPEPSPRLTLVGAAYLNNFFLPRLAEALPGVQLYSIEVPPGVAAADATMPLFDVALTLGGDRFPGSWSVARVGTVRYALFASPKLARRLGPRPEIEKVRATTFIGPIYAWRGQAVSGDDRCPLPASARTFGHRTQTVALALELAETVHQLVFAAAIAARDPVARGRLVEIPVDDWDVREPLFLACHAERVSSAMQRAMSGALRAALAE